MALDKKEKRKEQHRLEMLHAAELVFARQGYHLTTMEAVAEECGWSKGTLYLYFKSKEDLFFSILIEKMDQFTATLLSKLHASEGIQGKITALVEAQFYFFTENKNFFQLVLSEQGKVMQSSDSGLREKMLAQQHSHIDQVAAAIQQGLPKTSPINSSILAVSIIGAINLHLMTWMMAPETHDLEVIKSQVISLFVNGISPDEKI
ncbi:MAG: TetR/AcrR family transcriptional regulator [Candidatus Marinimicrobia bacterium]|nr:TetR/AcrR family transcriptional regulator [Candidatus Neomarinimicrobiota bacterium]